jgi:hypothetical protein
LYATYPESPGADAPGPEECQALAVLAAALLDGIEANVFNVPHPRIRAFAGELARLREALEANPAPAALRNASPAVSTLLERYRLTAEELRERESAEVSQIISMLNQTVAALSGGSERSVGRLRQIESELKQAVALPDIVALKARLSETLTYVREQSIREKIESAREVTALKNETSRVRERIALARGGLPGRAELEQHLAAVLSRPVRGVLAGFVLDRAPAIHQRFGDAAGERYVFLFVQDLLRLLPSPSKTFRWSEGVLVVDIETTTQPETVRADLRNSMAGLPPERRLDVGPRVAIFSNQHRWLVIPVTGSPTPAELMARIEALVRA